MRKLAADGQTQARAAVFSGGARVGLLEGFENDLLLFRRDADAGIGHGERDHRGHLAQDGVIGAPARFGQAHLQSHTAVRGELERVG
jgi:hypothetical protein